MHRLRERLGRSGRPPTTRKRAVEQVNALLSDTQAAPWLTRHPEMPEWHLHLASVHDPLAQRMGAEMAMALADLIRAGELRRLKMCAAPDCDAVVMDLSRNRSRIFCDTGNCGNRQHVAAYRERRAQETDVTAGRTRGCGDSGRGRVTHWPPAGPTSPRPRCSPAFMPESVQSPARTRLS